MPSRTRELLGTDAYFGGYVDWDAAHLHPLNLALGVAKRCIELGVRVYEDTAALGFDDTGSVTVRTATRQRDRGPSGPRRERLSRQSRAETRRSHHADQQLHHRNRTARRERLANEINPRRVAVGDSRFVINYFRMSPDGRLLFGGGENYRRGFPRDIAAFVQTVHAEDLSAARTTRRSTTRGAARSRSRSTGCRISAG